MQTRFRRALAIDVPLVITGALTKKTRKLVEAMSQITLPDGTVVADSTATMFILGAKGAAGA
jgi:hypothetical protein